MALMAPSHAPYLEITAPDDDMEISSDAGRVEHDNDIDLVDGDDEIDYMLEDSRSEQGQPRIDEMPDVGRDDIMYDDDLDEITFPEDDMNDDVIVPDEHLTDGSEFRAESGFEQFGPSQTGDRQATPTQANPSGTLDASTASKQQTPEAETLVDTVDYLESVQQDQKYNAPTPTADTESHMPGSGLEARGHEHKNVQEDVDTVAFQSLVPGEDGSTSAPSYDGLDVPFDEGSNLQQHSESANSAFHDDALEPLLDDNQQLNAASEHQHTSPKQTELEEPIVLLQEEITPSPNPHENEGSPQHTSHNTSEEVLGSDEGPRSLHSIIVDYEGAHVSLFPPMHGDEADMFLLNDASLADKTLVDLFHACRQVLGESVDDDLELEIHSEDLDLTISEDSVHCMTTSFSQLVDVYVTLCQQDGVDQPEPFFIGLNKKSRWSSRLTALYLAADESKGLSAMRTEPYLEEYTEEGEEQYEDENPEVEEIAPVGSDTESKSEVLKEEITEGQQIATTNTTDKEPANGDYDTHDEPTNVVEVTQEGENKVHGIEANDEPAQEEYGQPRSPVQELDLPEDNLDPLEEAKEEALVEEDSLDQNGGVENGDDESSGSSTVQGENDAHYSSQCSSSDTYEDDNDDSWLIDDEDTVQEGSPEHPSVGSDRSVDILLKSASNTNAEDQAFALHDDGEWPEMDDHVQDDAYAENSYEEDISFEDPEAVAQDWDDQVGHEDAEHYPDGKQEEVPQLNESSEQVAESEWATFDEELDFDVAEEHQAEEVNAPATEHAASSGTFRVPDESAGEEDEDSITYDDEELDLPTQPKTDAVQVRSSSQSPLGKRSRDDDENGGDDGSDQESKRLKSH